MLAVLTVDTVADESDGVLVGGISLRDALAAASSGDTIDFDPSLYSSDPATILLGDTDGNGTIGGAESPTQLTVNTTVTIEGPGADQVTIDAGGENRIFYLGSGIDVTIEGLTLTGGDVDGLSSGNKGGAIDSDADLLTLDSVIVHSNLAAWGGALYVPLGDVDIANSYFYGNKAQDTYGKRGGAIYFASAGTLDVFGSTFYDNHATTDLGFGGAIEVKDSTATILNSTFSSNDAKRGGAIHVTGSSSDVTIVNSTIFDNVGSTDGGGIRIASTGTVELHNTIVSGNTTNGATADNIAGTADSTSSYNLVGTGGNGGLSSSPPYYNILDEDDPGLEATLEDNRGPTMTHALLEDSPAIDQGTDSVLGTPHNLTTDQRGGSYARNVDVNTETDGNDGYVDIGAFEAIPPTINSNNKLVVSEDLEFTIDSSLLSSSDVEDTSATDITYTLDIVPTNGKLKLDGVDLVATNTFTQQEIDDGELSYEHDGTETSTDSFDFTVRDSHAIGTSGTFNINVTAINDAPVITAPTSTPSVSEGANLNLHNSTADEHFAISDADAGTADVQVTLSVDQGTVTFAANTSGVDHVSGSGTSVVVLEGTLTELNDLFDDTSDGTLVYENDNDAPIAQATLRVTVNDLGNTGAPEQHSVTLPIDVTPVNDAPKNNVPSNSVPVAGIETTALSGFSITDDETRREDPEDPQDLVTTQLSVNHGDLGVTEQQGTTIIAGADNSDNLTLQGTVAGINATLATLNYALGVTNTVFGAAAATLTILTKDNYSDSGGSLQDSDTVDIDIAGYFKVDTEVDEADTNIGNKAVDTSSGTTLRAAIQEANAMDVPVTIEVPAGDYVLSLTGTESNSAVVYDLDIKNEITIIGAGAGETIIDASGLSAGTDSRVFEISGSGHSLDLSGATVTGGIVEDSGSGIGGGIYVRNSGVLVLSNSAIVDNETDGDGGGIRSFNADVTVRDSVFANNQADNRGGGISSHGSGSLTVGSTVFANNNADATTDPADNLRVTGTVTETDLGYNLYDQTNTSGFFDHSTSVNVGTFDHVVTSLKDDSINTSDDSSVLSLREAVVLANASTDESILLPAWVLELEEMGSETAGTANANVNDLDITSTVTIRGVGAGFSIIDATKLGVDSDYKQDRVFQIDGDDSGELDLSWVTVTGGHVTNNGEGGGGISVLDGGTLTLENSAVVDNYSSGIGGGIRSNSSSTTIRKSVFTGNESDNGSGGTAGGLSSDGSSGTIIIDSSVFIHNTAASSANVRITGAPTTSDSEGNNLVGDDDTVDADFFDETGDYTLPSFDTVEHVVTSLRDSIDDTDDAYALSLREAVIKANSTANAAIDDPDNIWLPDWDFKLQLDTDDTVDELFAAEDDLDVLDSLNVRGTGGTEVEIDYDTNYTSDTDQVFSLYPFHHDHLMSFESTGISYAGETPPSQITDLLQTGTPDPTLEAFDTPKLPFDDSGAAGSPQVAEYDHTAGPGHSITITGVDLSTFTGDRIGQDTTALFYGQDAATGKTIFGEGTVLRVNGEDVSDDGTIDYQVAQVSLPDNLPAWSSYLMWVGNADGWSEPMMLNRTEVWWAGGPDRLRYGAIASVFGKNLAHDNTAIPSGNDFTDDMFVYVEALDAEGNREGLLAASLQDGLNDAYGINPYKIDFEVPDFSSVSNIDSYRLWVHNGHGDDYGWADPIAIEIDDSIALPFDDIINESEVIEASLGIDITDQSELDNHNTNLEALEYDASASDNSQRLNEIVDHFRNDDVSLYLPEDTYKFDATITWYSGVSLIGDGKGTTILEVHEPTDPLDLTSFIDLTGDSSAGFKDLTVQLATGPDPTTDVTATLADNQAVFSGNTFGVSTHPGDLVFDNIEVNAALSRPFKFNNLKGAKLSSIDIIGDFSSFGDSEDIFIDDVHYEFRANADNAFSFANPNNLSITNSSARDFDSIDGTYGNWDMADTDDWGVGRFIAINSIGGTPENIYIGDNDTYDLSVNYDLNQANEGEHISFEGTGRRTSRAVGQVSSVNNGTGEITFLINPSDMFDRSNIVDVDGTLVSGVDFETAFGDAKLVVVDGKGLGQYRSTSLQSGDPGYLNVSTSLNSEGYIVATYTPDTSWEVLPDLSTTVALLQTPTNVAIYNNDLDFKDYAPEATGNKLAGGVEPTGEKYFQPLSASGIVVDDGGINFVIDSNQTQESRIGLALRAGNADKEDVIPTREDQYAMPLYWIQTVNNGFGVDLERDGDQGGDNPETHQGIVVEGGRPDGAVRTLGLSFLDNTIESKDIIRLVDDEPVTDITIDIPGEGITVIPFDATWDQGSGPAFSRPPQHTGPNYLIFDGNAVEATDGFVNQAFVIARGSSLIGGFHTMVDSYPEHLAFVDNAFYSGSTSAVEMKYNLIVDQESQKVEASDAMFHGQWRDDPVHTPRLDADYRFHVLSGNKFYTGGVGSTTEEAPTNVLTDIGNPNLLDDQETEYLDYLQGEIDQAEEAAEQGMELNAMALNNVIRLPLTQGDTLSGLDFGIANMGLRDLKIVDDATLGEAVVSDHSWISFPADPVDTVIAEGASYDLGFDISAKGLAVGTHQATITLFLESNDGDALDTSITMTVFLEVLA